MGDTFTHTWSQLLFSFKKKKKKKLHVHVCLEILVDLRIVI
jgi:hypothetical protein